MLPSGAIEDGDADAGEPDEEEHVDIPKSGRDGPIPVPDDMKHLPLNFYMVERFVQAFALKFHADDHFATGSVFDGLPANPTKPTTFGYVVRNLPISDIGVLPREEIIQELLEDQVKDAKQRRDIGFPRPEQES